MCPMALSVNRCRPNIDHINSVTLFSEGIPPNKRAPDLGNTRLGFKV